MNLLLAVLLAVPARAAKPSDMDSLEKAGSLSSPELLAEMAGAEASNLENAMAKGRVEAERAAEHLAALMFSARALGAALQADLGPAAGEEEGEDLALHTAALKEKDAAFRRALASADLKAPANDADKLAAARRAYAAPDRRRDLRLAEDFLKAADAKAKGVKAAAPARAAAAAADAFVSEAAALERLASALDLKLSARRAAEPKLAAALEAAKPRRLALGADIAALKTEARLLECALALAAHDDAAFDAPAKKDAGGDED